MKARDRKDFPRLETPRLILRAMESADARGYGELLADETTHPYITDAGPIGASEVAARSHLDNRRFRKTGVVSAAGGKRNEFRRAAPKAAIRSEHR